MQRKLGRNQSCFSDQFEDNRWFDLEICELIAPKLGLVEVVLLLPLKNLVFIKWMSNQDKMINKAQSWFYLASQM